MSEAIKQRTAPRPEIVPVSQSFEVVKELPCPIHHSNRIFVKRRPNDMAELVLVHPNGQAKVFEYGDREEIEALAKELKEFLKDVPPLKVKSAEVN